MNYTLKTDQLEIEITLTKAGIEIIEMDRDDVELEFTDLRKNSVDEIFHITFQDDILSIREKPWKKSSLTASFFRNGINTDLILKVPRQTQIQGVISTVSGSIKADSINYSGKIKTISGQMRFGDISANRLRLRSLGGNISIDNFNGALSAKVISGKTTIKSGHIVGLALNSVSGDITVNADFENNRNCTFNTVSGDIELNILSYNSSDNLFLSTLSGRTSITGDYPKDKVEIKKRMPFLKNHPFKSFVPVMKDFVSSFTSMRDDEDIEIHAQAENEVAKNTKMILEMLAGGKITADEAEKLINALKT